MARQKEFDESVALEQAMQAFWRGGYTATGVQELVDTTRVNRASLYGTFGNKHELFLAALRHYVEQRIVALRDALESAPTAMSGIRDVLDGYLEETLSTRSGCLLFNTALEVAGRDAAIAAEVRRGLERIEAVIGECVSRGQESGEVLPRPPEMQTRLLMAVIQSMAIRACAGEERAVLESLRDSALLALAPAPVN